MESSNDGGDGIGFPRLQRVRAGVATWVALAALAAGSAACGSQETEPEARAPTSAAAETAVEGSLDAGDRAADAAPSDTGTGTAAPAPPVEPDPAALVARGKQVYNSNCIACHNMNPTQPGALGPDLADSPLPLVEGKVLRNEYPSGYAPKRDTKAMIPLPHLEKDIPAIVAYLDSVK